MKIQAGDLWKSEGYTFTHELDKHGILHIHALAPDGSLAGEFQFADDVEPNVLIPLLSEVDSAHRRKGLASRAYDLAQEITGIPVDPSLSQTPDAKRFWADRLSASYPAVARVLSEADWFPPYTDASAEETDAAVSPEQIELDIELWLGKVYIHLDGEMVGEMDVSEAGGLLTVEFIEVDRSARGQGIAAAALKKLKEILKKEGGIRGIYAEMIWQGSLKAFLNGLGKPNFLGNDIHKLSVDEAMEQLPAQQVERGADGMFDAGVHVDGRWDIAASVEASEQVEEKLVYHGSPHDFDEFSLDWAGDTQGTAMGWGIYCSTDKKTSEFYTRLTGDQNKRGILYRVEIPDGDVYLDWDTIVQKQKPKIRKILEQTPRYKEATERAQTGQYLSGWQLKGQEFYGGLKHFDKMTEKEASLYLLSLGIKGIRYKAGDVTNYVIFDASDVKIKGKKQLKPDGKAEAQYPTVARLLREK